ncbi:MAG: hypothetical protein K9L59_17280 [Desulfobacterales bacterium]|nr:hypothetical protein [Desulfobacterales bacterium]
MRAQTFHRRLSLALKGILLIEAAVAVWDQQWLTAGVTVEIIVITLIPQLMAKSLRVHTPPEFELLAIAFVFAIGIGALWEIFEYGMDSFFGMNMQKEMRGDPSGLTDTMWDMIVNTVGALVIAVLGYGYLKTAGSQSFLERWIHAFIESNPRLFERGR